MWSRRELKRKAKASFKANYWKTVLIALLVVSLMGTGSAVGSASGLSSSTASKTTGQGSESSAIYTTTDYETFAQDLDDLSGDPEMDPREIASMIEELSGTTSGASQALPPAVALFFVVLAAVLVVVAIVLEVLIFNPLQVGTARFFLCNLGRRAEVKEVAFGYDHNYREGVKTLFWRDVYVFLWSLLLIVPGIVKSYEYRMIPYLLSEDETMTKQRAFAESKRMMHGQKWRAFVLDLSFIGWYLLSLLTLGLAAVFYVNPYKCMTDAALYEKLRYGAPVGGDYFVRAAAPAQAPASPMGTNV